MNRFSNNSKLNKTKLVRLFPLAIGIIVVVIFLNGVNYISSSSIDKQQESLENALTRDVAQCYATEGVYPPSLNYLSEHYGLTYNEDLFFVDYQYIGGNIHPDVTIIRLSE